MGRQSLGLYSDVSDSGQVADMLRQALDKFGKVDILVNNAGSRPGKDRVPVVELEEEAFDEVLRVNVPGDLPLLPSCGPAHDSQGWRRQNNQYILRRRQEGHGPLRRLLRFQVCRHWVHPGYGPRRWPAIR